MFQVFNSSARREKCRRHEPPRKKPTRKSGDRRFGTTTSGTPPCLCAMCGVPLSWNKTAGGDTVVWVGLVLLAEQSGAQHDLVRRKRTRVQPSVRGSTLHVVDITPTHRCSPSPSPCFARWQLGTMEMTSPMGGFDCGFVGLRTHLEEASNQDRSQRAACQSPVVLMAMDSHGHIGSGSAPAMRRC